MKKIFLILVLALLVRLVGINWGLPSVYHIDESTLVRAAMGMRFGDLNPHFFDWPSLYKYLCHFLFSAFIKLRIPIQVRFGVETMRRILPFWWGSIAPFYLLARLMTAFLDVGSVGLVFLIGQKLYNKHVGLLAALVMALSFTNVHATQYNRVDVPTLFFVLISFCFSILILEKGRRRDYLLAGLFAGFATSTKYNGALIVIPIIAAYFLRILDARRRKNLKVGNVSKTYPFGPVLGSIWKLLLAGLATGVGFLLGTPYALLDYKTFLFRGDARGFLWQVGTMGKGLNWHNIITGAMITDWGILMTLLFLVGVLWAIKNYRPKEILLLSFPLLYFSYMGTWGIVGGHYVLLLYPFLAMLASNFIQAVWQPKFGGAIPMALLCICLAYPFARIAENDVSGFRGDTRNLARDWILNNIPPQARIAIDGASWPSYLGGILPILPRIEDNPEGYYIFPFEGNVIKYGRHLC